MRIGRLIAMLCKLLLNMLLPLAWLDLLRAKVSWGYDGDEGPDHWGCLSPRFSLCADGAAQSPIDLKDAREAALPAIEFHYGSALCRLVNTAATVQVDVERGNKIVYDGAAFELLQFHFHSPSEHTVAGHRAAMEIHFVHQKRGSQDLAVVGILLTAGESENGGYAAIFDNLPAEAGARGLSLGPLSLAALLPPAQGYYSYAGSLTMPPCSENVLWLLLDTPVALSAGQIAAFRAIYEGNARPTQPLGNRELLHHIG